MLMVSLFLLGMLLFCCRKSKEDNEELRILFVKPKIKFSSDTNDRIGTTIQEFRNYYSVSCQNGQFIKLVLIIMLPYEEQAYKELELWKKKILKKPGFFNLVSKGIQNRLNKLIPEKVHNAITVAIEKMVKAVLFGAKYITKEPREDSSLQLREAFVRERIQFYRKTASAEGAVTGAGGFLLGLAEFPILIGIKMKLLFDIAALYGYDVKDYRERLYILYIFQLAFSSQQGRNRVYQQISDWNSYISSLPEDVDQFDWRTFQQEYRDYIDLAKMAQLIPVIGAAVGAIVNYKLINKLGETAINCYRMRKVSPLKIISQGRKGVS
jgi:uncharacterized protein (DUF697 family)